jgi:hypothetical protein
MDIINNTNPVKVEESVKSVQPSLIEQYKAPLLIGGVILFIWLITKDDKKPIITI